MSAKLAREGKLDELFAQMTTTSSAINREVYKWLCAAEDFGYDAEDTIGDLLECSSLRYDDDGYEQAAAHWELARAYLLGEDLPFSLELAAKHLERFLEPFTLEELREGTCVPGDADDVKAQLEGEALAVLVQALTPDPYREVARRMKRVRQLREIGSVPKVILRNEAGLLMDALVEWLGDDLP